MSFGGQRIANTYALWTKVRRRGDSNGQKVYSPSVLGATRTNE